MATGYGGCGLLAPQPVLGLGGSLLKSLASRTHRGLGYPQLSREIQCSVASYIQGLVKSEKNRQVACEAGMLRTLMAACGQALATGSGALHGGLVRIFEKLASQAIEPDVLRYEPRPARSLSGQAQCPERGPRAPPSLPALPLRGQAEPGGCA